MAGSGRQNADPLLIAALLSGATLATAAERAGVSEQTARRRLHDPEFHARLDAAGEELIAAATRALADASGEAVSTLRDLLRDGPPAVKLGAARAILEFGPRWRTEHANDERLAAAERSAAELSNAPRKER
jgi:hypothetical protein